MTILKPHNMKWIKPNIESECPKRQAYGKFRQVGGRLLRGLIIPIGKGIYHYQHKDGFFSSTSEAIVEWLDESKEDERIIKELEEWIDNEIATSKNKLNDLSPLGRHALQAPVKAQIALLEDMKLKFIPKTLKDIQ